MPPPGCVRRPSAPEARCATLTRVLATPALLRALWGWPVLAACALGLALPSLAAAGDRFVPGPRSPGLRGSGGFSSSPARSATDARIRFGTLLGPGGGRHTTLVGTGTTPFHRVIPQGGGLERPAQPLARPIFVGVGEVVYEIRVSGDVVIVLDE